MKIIRIMILELPLHLKFYSIVLFLILATLFIKIISHNDSCICYLSKDVIKSRSLTFWRNFREHELVKVIIIFKINTKICFLEILGALERTLKNDFKWRNWAVCIRTINS